MPILELRKVVRAAYRLGRRVQRPVEEGPSTSWQRETKRTQRGAASLFWFLGFACLKREYLRSLHALGGYRICVVAIERSLLRSKLSYSIASHNHITSGKLMAYMGEPLGRRHCHG